MKQSSANPAFKLFAPADLKDRHTPNDLRIGNFVAWMLSAGFLPMEVIGNVLQWLKVTSKTSLEH